MNTHTITRPITKLCNSPLSIEWLRSLTLPKKVRKLPGHFVFALAHEVRNPLTNINLALEMLQSTIMNDEQKIYLDIVKRSSLRISGLVSDLLSSCKPDEIQSERYCIHKLLDEVLAMTEDRIKLKNITVRKDYTAIDCKVWVNKQQIKIALINIIINAIDAMHSETGQLILVTRSIQEKCSIEIEDNGIGISEENLVNIFKPFFTNKAGGMGLGLSTTLDILHFNHARVDVTSELGKGTRFILSFDSI